MCSPATINRMEKDGRLNRLSDIPGCFYRAADVYALCNYKDTERGQIEALEQKNKALAEENRVLKQKLDRVHTVLKELL